MLAKKIKKASFLLSLLSYASNFQKFSPRYCQASCFATYLCIP